MKPLTPMVLLGIVLLFTQAFTELWLPNLMSELVDVGIIQMNNQPNQMSFILLEGAKMLGVALISVTAAISVSFVLTKMAAEIGKRMRHDVFIRVLSFSSNEFDKFSTASLITRTTNDIQQLQNLFTTSLRMICFAPIMGFGSMIMALKKSSSISWILLVAVLVLSVLIAVVFSLVIPKIKKLQKLIDRLNLVSRENLTGMMVIRAFGNEKYEEKRFENANNELRFTNRFVQRMVSVAQPGMTIIMNFTTVAVVWLGAKAISQAQFEVGDMLAYIQYAMHVIMSFLFVAVTFISLPRAAVSAGRIQEVLNTDTSIANKEQPITLDAPKGVLSFENVSFRYENADDDVLSDISFTALPGQTTAFIGATGSGKSTLVNLIPRFYDVTQGSIRLDGVDIRDLSIEQLRRSIGFVPQKGILFSGDVASNLRFGRQEATQEEMDEALRIAQANFILESDKKTETEITQGGTNVSGGQRQRLAIARALVKKSPVYIFDDSFSALDLKTDAALRRALKGYTEQATVLIVAQRVSTIMRAEQIIVLDDGKIVGKGTHEQLLEACPQYLEIAQSQLTKEELK
ncbi:MAG TPA: multidrug ABC transporter ATP-binding protein [Ruminococcaceae bacterium]|nr:multidrug ABC transporter ATP-binding protein [Oscillospiraceae bacterium]